MNSIQDQQNLNGKKVLLRLDLNVPLKEGIIKDETRINKIIPILNFLLSPTPLHLMFGGSLKLLVSKLHSFMLALQGISSVDFQIFSFVESFMALIH